jgi:hypothetical protein
MQQPQIAQRPGQFYVAIPVTVRMQDLAAPFDCGFRQLFPRLAEHSSERGLGWAMDGSTWRGRVAL